MDDLLTYINEKINAADKAIIKLETKLAQTHAAREYLYSTLTRLQGNPPAPEPDEPIKEPVPPYPEGPFDLRPIPATTPTPPAPEPSHPQPKPRRRSITLEQVRDVVMDQIVPRIEHGDPDHFLPKNPRIVKMLGRKSGTFTAKDVMSTMDISPGTAGKRLKELADQGKLEAIPCSNPTRMQYRYPDYRPVVMDKSDKQASDKQASKPKPGCAAVPGTGRTGTNGRHGNKEIEEILRIARGQGFIAEKKGAHWRVTRPGRGTYKTVSSTPSDRNAVNQVRRSLSQLGVKF